MARRDRRRRGGPEPDTSDETYPNLGARATEGNPGPTHEAFMEEIEARIRAIVDEYVPTMGTVLGMDGGEVLVSLDNESGDRTVAIPRKRGMRYLAGDRVKVQKFRGGEYVADGTISTKAGEDPAVDGDDIFTDAITSRQIKRNAVDREGLADSAVEPGHLHQLVRDMITAAGALGTDAKTHSVTLRDDTFGGPKSLEGKLNDLDDKVFGNNGLKADVSTNKTDITGLKKDIGNQGLGGDISSLKSKIGTIESDITKIKKDIKNLKPK